VQVTETIEEVPKAVPGLEDKIGDSIADPSHISLTTNENGRTTLVSNSPSGEVLTLPADSSSAISMSTADGTNLIVGLPGQSVPSQPIFGNALAYEQVLESTHIVAYAKADSAVRLLVAIEDSNAPTTFNFSIGPEDDNVLRALNDGRVAVVDGDDSVIAIVEVPWAYDSTGSKIPTRFRVIDDLLVFEVSHSQTTNYPVIADPDFNWGWTSGTIYFSRYETEDIAIFGTSTLMAYIAVLTAIPTIITTLIGLLALTILAWAVDAYYKSNACLKIRVGLSWSWTGLNPFVNPGHYTCNQ
jgi:hypothetical protein